MDDIGIREHFGNLVAMSQQQFRVPLFDMALPLFGQLDLSMEPRAGKATDHTLSIASTNRRANVQ